MKKIKIIQTKIGEIALLESGIIRVQGNKGVHIELEDMKENDVAFRELQGKNRAPFLVIFGEDAFISTEAREYFADEMRSQLKVAEALIVPSLYHKMIARNHISSGKPKYPTQLFEHEEEGLKWLKQFCVAANTGLAYG